MSADATLPTVTPPRYGADATGLICGYLLESGPDIEPIGRPIDSDEAARWLAEAGHAGFVWLHFNLAHTGALPWLRQHAELSDAFFETLYDGLHSTRIERSEEALIAVVNDLHFDFAFEPSDIATLWVQVDQRLVITARRQLLRSVDKLREAVKSGQALRSSAELLEHLVCAQADVLVKVVRGATERVDRIEDDLLANRLDRKRARLGALRRLLVRLQRLLAPEPAALFRLLQHPPAWWPSSMCRNCGRRAMSFRSRCAA